jgi:7-carboxy-7-deazaguanine synthase
LVSEIFRSVQGEGRHVGVPSVFLRLARCNLSCRWCDTPYTWDFERFDFEREVRRRPLDEVADELLDAGVAHVVITGGEPLLQQRELEGLLEELDRRRAEAGRARLFVEVETNGTVPPTEALLRRVDHFNVSPKLENSGEPASRRLRPRALEILRETGRADLKLVVGEADIEEADALIESLGWPRERVLFMPEATDRETLRARGPLISAAALRRGVRYTSRLHIELFGGRRGT